MIIELIYICWFKIKHNFVCCLSEKLKSARGVNEISEWMSTAETACDFTENESGQINQKGQSETSSSNKQSCVLS